MGESHSSNSGTSITNSASSSTVDSSHNNHNEFGSQSVAIRGSAGAGTSISFSNLALLGQDSRTWTPLGLPQKEVVAVLLIWSNLLKGNLQKIKTLF